jgi:cytidylate kinase
VAALTERVDRRVAEIRASDPRVDAEAVRKALETRDRLDESRAADPLAQAPDAVLLDTTGLTPASVLAKVVALVRSRIPLDTAE